MTEKTDQEAREAAARAENGSSQAQSRALLWSHIRATTQSAFH